MFKKFRIAVLLSAAVVFSFVKADLYAYNVNDFNDLVSAISGFETNITFTTDTVNYTAHLSTVNYAGPIDIYGSGAALDGMGLYRIFYFENTNITFYDSINFIGGYADGNGGAIYNDGSQINFEMSSGDLITFSSNTADFGGAICNSGNIGFSGGFVKFDNNEAYRLFSSIGGAIYNTANSTMTFSNVNVIFDGNIARDSGGAIYNNGNISFSGSIVRFENNMMSSYDPYKTGGGAISNSNNGNIDFTGSSMIFSGNRAQFGSGGAIYNAGNSRINFEMSPGNMLIFSGNTAILSVGVTPDGGAVYNYDGSLINFDMSSGGSAIFENNTAYHGGAICNWIGSTITFTNGEITFAGNNAYYGGGALFNVYGSRIDFDMSSGGTIIFSSNTVDLYGGGAIGNWDNSTITFTNGNITFIDNYSAGIGSAICNFGFINFDMSPGDLMIFSGNTANYGGGAISNSRIMTFTNGEIIFTGNSGGAISNGGDANISFNASTVTFSNNDAAIFNAENSTMTFTNGNVTFDGNGVAIVNSGNSTLIFTNGEIMFTENFSGAIFNGSEANILFTESTVTFSGNTANSGGAIYGYGKYGWSYKTNISFNASEVTFSSNTANEGGAIYNVYASAIAFTNGNVTFVGNTADLHGGAIFNASVPFSPEEEMPAYISFAQSAVNFDGNTADAGGAIYNGCHSNILFTESAVTFSSNTAANEGGAIYNTGMRWLGANIAFNASTAAFSGNTADTGGAIYNTEEASISFNASAAAFTGNTVSTLGGAIYNSGNIGFSGGFVKFENNAASSFAYFYNNGGAIYNTADSIMTFANGNVIFDGNTARYSGGAVYNNGNVSFSNSIVKFENNEISNTSYGFGGAIYNTSGSTMTFANSNVVFDGNIATDRGGAIDNSGNISFSNSIVKFENNIIAHAHYVDPYFGGGAIYNANGNIDFIGNSIIFSGNIGNIHNMSMSNNGFGGAIYNDNSRINFDMSSGGSAIFENNEGLAGGAIWNYSSTITFTSGEIMFTGNTAAAQGGAIENRYGRIDFKMSAGDTIIFSSNTTSPAYGYSGYGGAIFNNLNSTITFTNGNIMFIDNSATIGGAIINGGLVNFDMSPGDLIIFSGNTAEWSNGAISNVGIMTFTNGEIIFTGNSGGAISNDSDANISFNASTVTFSSNTGGAINNSDNSTMTFTNGKVTFDGNTSAWDGGALVNYGDSIITFTNTDVMFSGNTSSGWDGGGVICNSSRSKILFTGNTVVFSGNTADQYGGAIYNWGNETDISFNASTVTFSGNTADTGGAIYNVLGSEVKFINGNVTFTGNTADLHGGAIFNASVQTSPEEPYRSLISFAESAATFSGNTADAGGAIYNGDNSDILFMKSAVTFSSNTAANEGGAIYNTGMHWHGANIAFNASTAAFSGNTADTGGAIYNTEEASISFNASAAVFISNTADEGGAIYNNRGSAMVFVNGDIKFTGNSADAGGAIYNTSLPSSNPWQVFPPSDISFTGSATAFDGNTADTGGAIYNTQGASISFNASAAAFTGNTANEGGAIYNVYGSNMSFTESAVTFSSNTADTGAAIYNAENSTITFTGGDIKFTGNSAAEGAAIYNYGSSLINFEMLTGDTIIFDGNTVDFSGAAIYNVENSTLTFTGGDIKFTGNRADSGAAVFNYDNSRTDFETFSGDSIIFTGNTADTYGGAIYNGFNSRINFNTAQGSTITFAGNTAVYGRDIYNNSGSTVNMTGAGNIIFGGGIEGGGSINKSGSGKVHFEAGSKTDIGGSFNIAGGNVYFSTSASISSMNVGAAGALTLDVDFIGSLTSILYFDDITIDANSLLYINNISTGTLGYGKYSETIFYSSSTNNGTFADSNIYDVETGSSIYNLVWQPGSYAGGYSYMGLLTLDILGPWNKFVAAYKAVTSGNTIYLDQNIKAAAGDEDPFGFPADTNITIAGNGGVYIIDSDGRADKGLTILSTQTINIENLTFQNFYSSAYGGVIYSSGTVNISGDISFINNTANSGGAIYNGNNSVMDFAASLVSFINNSANIGGAIYSDSGANTNFSGGEVNFINNEAGEKGGAIYIADSTVSFDTDGGSVTFRNNTADGKANDVYMDADGVLNISGSNKIKFEGGIVTSSINVSGIEINKSGSGEMYLGGNSEIWGDFNISGGDIIMLASATYRGKALELGSSALDMHNGTVNKIEVDGKFESKTDLKIDIFSSGANDEIKAGSADIDGNIDIFAGVGTYKSKEYHLIITSNNLTGVFTSSALIPADNKKLNYELRYEDGIVKLIVDGLMVTKFEDLCPLTYNQSETAGAFKKISENPGDWEQILNDMVIKQNNGTDAETSEVKDFLAQTSGYFLSNVIRNMAADSPNNEVYDKIRNHREEYETNSGLWVQLKGGMESFKKDENSLEDYRDVSMGVMFGFDRFIDRYPAGGDIMWGVYGRINKDNIEQGKHKADGNKNGLGLYGGYIKENWELKAMLLGSYDKFNTERMTYGGNYAKADITALTMSADVEAVLKTLLTENIEVRNYAGIEMQSTMYGGFKEKGAGMYNLEVSEGNYLRSAARLGMGLDYEKGKWIWYANVEGKYMIEGTKSEIESKFENTGAGFYSRGSEEGKAQIGVGLGGEVKIAENWKAFANVKYYAAERYENLYGNAGVRYMFGKKESEEEPEVNDTQAELEEAESQEMLRQNEERKKIAEEEEARRDQEKRIEKQMMEEDARRAAALEKARRQAEIDADNEAAMEKAREEARKRREKPVLKSFSMDMASFAVNSAKLSEKAKANIALQAQEIKQFKYQNMTIEGHTDKTGSVELNKRLSTRRAKAVYDEFVINGIPEEKLSYIGFASTMPKADNKTAAGRAQNRRVEIFVE